MIPVEFYVGKSPEDTVKLERIFKGGSTVLQ